MILLLAGCGSVPAPFGGELPLPPGAEALPDEVKEQMFQSRGEDVLFTGYLSDASADEIVAFYREQVPAGYTLKEKENHHLTLTREQAEPGTAFIYTVKVAARDGRRLVTLVRIGTPSE